MISEKIEAEFVSGILAGAAYKDALSIVTESAHKHSPYKRYGSIKTQLYVFWDGSAMIVGLGEGGRVFYAAVESCEAADAVVLEGEYE